MLTTAQLLEPLARHRTNEVVVTTMSTVRPWGRLSNSDLDFASADSAMGHAYVTAGDEDAIVLGVCWKPG